MTKILRRWARGLMVGALLTSAACASTSATQKSSDRVDTHPSAPASYAAQTTISLNNPRCSAQENGQSKCVCRPLDSDDKQREEAPPAAGHKRFEFRLPRSSSALWVEVSGQGIYYKAPEEILPSCFYLDLPIGEQQIRVHGQVGDKEVGLQTGLTIYEYGDKEGPHWYKVLDFSCGAQDRCDEEKWEAWFKEQRSLPRGVLDACGSTMIKGVQATGDRDTHKDDTYQTHTLQMTMKIYQFETYRAPGAKDCRAPAKNR